MNHINPMKPKRYRTPDYDTWRLRVPYEDYEPHPTLDPDDREEDNQDDEEE